MTTFPNDDDTASCLIPHADDDNAWENLDAWREWVNTRNSREASYLSAPSIDEWF